MTENFTNLAKDINRQVEEIKQTPNRLNPKKSTSKHNEAKLYKIKGKKKKKLKTVGGK